MRLAGAAAAAAASDELLDAVFSLLDTDGSGALDYDERQLHLAFRKPKLAAGGGSGSGSPTPGEAAGAKGVRGAYGAPPPAPKRQGSSLKPKAPAAPHRPAPTRGGSGKSIDGGAYPESTAPSRFDEYAPAIAAAAAATTSKGDVPSYLRPTRATTAAQMPKMPAAHLPPTDHVARMRSRAARGGHGVAPAGGGAEAAAASVFFVPEAEAQAARAAAEAEAAMAESTPPDAASIAAALMAEAAADVEAPYADETRLPPSPFGLRASATSFKCGADARRTDSPSVRFEAAPASPAVVAASPPARAPLADEDGVGGRGEAAEPDEASVVARVAQVAHVDRGGGGGGGARVLRAASRRLWLRFADSSAGGAPTSRGTSTRWSTCTIRPTTRRRSPTRRSCRSSATRWRSSSSASASSSRTMTTRGSRSSR